jgi:hypothetical protein
MLKGEQILGIIKSHKRKQEYDLRRWDKYRSWYLSEYWQKEEDVPQGAGGEYLDEGEEDVNLETNYPYAFIDTMISNICPTNPQVSVIARREKNRPAAKFREALINDCFRRNKLHKRMWSAATDGSLCGRAFIKTAWNFDRGTPETFVTDPRHVFFDLAAARWEDIRYLIEVTVLTEDEFQKRAKRKRDGSGANYRKAVVELAKPSGYPQWLEDRTRESEAINSSTKAYYRWVTVFEVYDFVGERYCHMLEDVDEPLFEGSLPYRYVKNPFSLLTFNDNKTDLGGLSDVRLIEGPQERLNEIDTLELWHAHTSIPVTVLNKALVDDPEEFMEMLRSANQPGMIAWLTAKNNAPLRDVIGSTPVPQMDPNFEKMRSRCTQIIEFILGIPQYSRGVVGVADVATEVALADTATRTRNGKRIKQMDDLVSDLGKKVVGLYEEFLPRDSELAIRLTDSREVLEVSRKSMLMAENREDGEEPLDYDYDAVPYSPTENHRIIQLKNLEKYLQILMQSKAIDQEKLMAKLLELLQLGDVLKTEEPPPPPGQEQPMGLPPEMAAMMGGGGIAPPGMPGMDNIATGALPEGTDVPISPTGVGGPGGPGIPMSAKGPRPQLPGAK